MVDVEQVIGLRSGTKRNVEESNVITLYPPRAALNYVCSNRNRGTTQLWAQAITFGRRKGTREPVYLQNKIVRHAKDAKVVVISTHDEPFSPIMPGREPHRSCRYEARHGTGARAKTGVWSLESGV